jgi:hypothetical protein
MKCTIGNRNGSPWRRVLRVLFSCKELLPRNLRHCFQYICFHGTFLHYQTLFLNTWICTTL